MTTELTGRALVLLRVGYPGSSIGAFAFYFLWEDGRPLLAFPARCAHIVTIDDQSGCGR